MSTSSRIPQIAVLVETSSSWGAQVVQGIAQYTRDHGYWSVFAEPRGDFERLYLPENWRGSGVIARVTTRRLADQIASLGLPCVNVSGSEVRGAKVASVIPDQGAVGKLAAQHLIEQGYRHFAYVGVQNQPNYNDRIGPGFGKELTDRGYACGVYSYSRSGVSWTEPLTELPDLDRWIAGLPKPVGLLTSDFRHGRLLTEACSRVNLLVPEDVGVVLAYNDDVLCELATPPLSSVDAAPIRVGYEAAALLSRLIEGSALPTLQILIPPVGVTTRRSTQPAAISDPVVADAVKFIQRHAHKAISVDDVLTEVTVSRRSLEQRFAKALGRSPAGEMRRRSPRPRHEFAVPDRPAYPSNRGRFRLQLYGSDVQHFPTRSGDDPFGLPVSSAAPSIGRASRYEDRSGGMTPKTAAAEYSG